MFNQLEEDEKAKYTKMGNYMYGIVDFETGKVLKDPNVELESILDALRSGLSIDDLTDKEKELVRHYWSSIDNVLTNDN